MSITFQHIMEKSMIYIRSSTMSLGDRFHVSRKAGKWVGSLKGENGTAALGWHWIGQFCSL